jgi:hypothetical protein
LNGRSEPDAVVPPYSSLPLSPYQSLTPYFPLTPPYPYALIPSLTPYFPIVMPSNPTSITLSPPNNYTDESALLNGQSEPDAEVQRLIPLIGSISKNKVHMYKFTYIYIYVYAYIYIYV